MVKARSVFGLGNMVARRAGSLVNKAGRTVLPAPRGSAMGLTSTFAGEYAGPRSIGLGTPEMAAMSAFPLACEAAFVTGHAVALNAGMYL